MPGVKGKSGSGGARPGAGRKSRAEELGLNDLMDSIGSTDKILQSLYKLAIKDNIEAQKIWLGYRFGKPKESVTIQDNTITWVEADGDKDS